MNLLPFNLEKALAGEPVVTRDGRPVKIAGYNPHAKGHANIAGWCEDYIIYWRQDGIWHADGTQSKCDLFMAPKPKVKLEGWVNIYRNNLMGALLCEGVFNSEKIATECANSHYKALATIRIEWEEEAE